MKLLISLGHNSSAVLTQGNKVLCGYEEERLSKIKSDSSFPKLAIQEILKHYPHARTSVDTVYVSHWFYLTGKPLEESKYFQPKFIKARFPNAKVVSHTESFTHHDAHARSVWNFSETTDGLTMVADGFGTNGETVSFYRNGELYKRYYNMSLGLMYQYTTSYLGMKENQDEYKMLGYEASVTKEAAEKIQPWVKTYSDEYYRFVKMNTRGQYSSVEYMCATNRTYVTNMLNTVFKDIENSRPNVAYFIQSLIESVVTRLITSHLWYGCKTMQFSGGIFYNVKLNNKILNEYQFVNLMEFMPLAGDQGAPLGFVDVEINDLMWGIRDIDLNIREEVEDFTFVCRGNMEFGPRALGNTSCIAPPKPESVERINTINGRNTVMPMASMISYEAADKYCRGVHRLGKCKAYMIVALDWLGPVEEFRGVLHNRPLSTTEYTCRPQIVDNEFTLANDVVINTSLNAHGQPIIFDKQDYQIMREIHRELGKPSIFKRVCNWNESRYDREYVHELMSSMLTEETTEFTDAVLPVDRLDALCDIAYISYGGLWKLGKTEVEGLIQDSVNSLSKLNIRYNELLFSAVLRFIELNNSKSQTLSDIIAACKLYSDKEFGEGVFDAALHIVADSNDTKPVIRTDFTIKFTDKGKNFVPPEPRLQALLDDLI